MQPTDNTTTTNSKPTQAVTVTTKARRVRKSAATAHAIPAHAKLSFVQGTITRFGWHASNWFAVPDEEYTDGFMTGLKAFQELQQFVKSQGETRGTPFQVQWVLEEAFKARNSGTANGKSKRGAAEAFIQCAAAYLTAMMARDSGRYVGDRMAQQQATADYFQAKAAQDRVKFIERMQAARAAKRAARMATADEVAA
jgi:hypothetical protein